MHNSNSNQATGTSGNPQTTVLQSTYAATVASNEEAVAEQHKEYLQKTLPRSSPIQIPTTATINEQEKTGYTQVKYTWKKGDYKYTCRWHTRTPNAPADQGNTWVVERIKPGIGAGPNARRKESHILVGKSGNSYKWVSKQTWNEAIRARKNGTATKEQEDLLTHGHWKAD